MIGCWLLVFGCRLVATILPTTKYQQPITLNFWRMGQIAWFSEHVMSL